MSDESERSDGRIERLFEVVSLASVGEYEAANERAAEGGTDALGALEDSVRVFVGELAAMDAARTAALAEVHAAKEALADKLAVIEAQQAAIRELSSPILDLWDGVIAVPLVGRVERGAALALTERLLAAVVARRARWALLDLTGVAGIDADTAACVVDLTRAVGLVGARCVLTGVTPAAATCLVEAGAGLGGIRCLADLREGLRFCLTQRRA